MCAKCRKYAKYLAVKQEQKSNIDELATDSENERGNHIEYFSHQKGGNNQEKDEIEHKPLN